ncbi:MAG TPA: hypothetical protein VFB38_05880 [Chthonomonadaceae bacterium]|nr:hypothetical protein [Chthonomonadaceae bacterium]
MFAHIVMRRGIPSSERCRGLRQFQAALAERPTHAELAQVVIARLSKLPPDEGLDTLDAALAPITEEAGKHHLKIGQPLAEPLERKVQRCLTAPVEVLAARDIIPSGEVLARVIPQITAQVSAASFADPDLQQL